MKRNIKSPFFQKAPPINFTPSQQAPVLDFSALTNLIATLTLAKENFEKAAQVKLQEIDSALQHILTIKEGKPGAPGESVDKDEVVQEILGLLPEIEDGEDGEDADEEAIIDSVLSRIEEKLPAPVDENRIVKKLLSKIPPPEKLIKGIHYDDGQPGKSPDIQEIIDELITTLEKDPKKKLKLRHIDGLEQTISSFSNQIGKKGYLHGGGDTLKAASGYTLLRNGDGTTSLVLTSAPGISVYEEVPSGSGATFTLAHTPLAGTLRVYRGGARQQLNTDYTIAVATLTLSFTLQSGESLVVDYSY